MVGIAVGALFSYLVAVLAVRATLGRRWRGTKFVTLDLRRGNRSEGIAALLALSTGVGIVGGTLLTAIGHPGPRLSPAASLTALAVGLALGGIALMVWSQLTMGASWRIGVDHRETTQLVTAGPFRRVRNPIYASMAVFAAGITILVPTAIVGAGWVATLIFVQWQVRAVEEPFLARKHTGDYISWASHAGRFVPWLGTLR